MSKVIGTYSLYQFLIFFDVVPNHVKHDIVESASDKQAQKNVAFQNVSSVVEEMVITNSSCEHGVLYLRH